MTEPQVSVVRDQFDKIPYPNMPIESSPKDDLNTRFKFCITTPHYRRSQQFVEPEGKIILDVGCGTGWLTLGLAIANPGARIIAIDISAESVKWAKNRLAHHNTPAEIHTMPFEEIPSLGLEFDFIHCSDTLYLLPDPLQALKVMASVLKPDGIIHGNLHSAYQRFYYYQGQKLAKFLGLMDGTPSEMEYGLMRELMNSLDDRVLLKERTWNLKPDDNFLAANHLLQSDKGYTIPDMFEMIGAAGLEFISMTNWNQWQVCDLYKDRKIPSEYLETILELATVEEGLHIYELLQPVNRLLDFWCCHPNQTPERTYISAWTDQDWQTAQIYLHPQLKRPKVREALDQAIALYAPFNIHVFININAPNPISLYTLSCTCLHLLWDAPLTLEQLASQWHSLKPCNWLTKAESTLETARNEIKQAVIEMEFFMYVLVAKPQE